MHRYDEEKYQFDMDLILEKTESCKQWGKWGPDDEWGTQNYVTDEDRVNAAKLVKKGKVFALGLNFDDEGPQRGLFGGRWMGRLCRRRRAGPCLRDRRLDP